MEDASMVDLFVSITQADPDIASHYLEACNWELENAVDTYLEDYQHPVQPEANGEADFVRELEGDDIPNEPGSPYAEVDETDDDNRDDFHTAENSPSPDHTDAFQSQVHDAAAYELDEAFDLPDGFGRSDVEEQQMLMAALHNHPFTGNLEAMLQSHAPPRPPSPGTLAARQLKEQQDREFEEARRQDLERAKEKTEKERREREAAVLEERRQKEAKESLGRILFDKKRSLPLEPSTDRDGIMVLMRFPDGSRSRRRFRKTDPVSALFDFVDVDVNEKLSNVPRPDFLNSEFFRVHLRVGGDWVDTIWQRNFQDD